MNTPIPARGELVRQIGEALRQKADLLGRVISLVMGKTLAEGTGEIYEIITVCNMALGLSRQLEGKIFPSERSNHVLLEVWNPLGVMGVISAFNYPAGVYGWNLAIGLVTGNCLV